MSANSVENNTAQRQLGDAAKYVFPVTFAQQRLWFIDRLQPFSVSYLVPWSLRLVGRLDAAALERSLKEIVQRHEVFRTTFTLRQGVPVQVVASSTEFAMPFVDLASDPQREQTVLAMARDEASRPMDLERGPLFRSALIRLGAEDHVLLLTTHHIIFDAWSRGILVRELATLYGAFSAGLPSPVPDPKLQYADYAVWQRKYFEGANLQKQLNYWKNQLAGIPAALEIPTNRPRPAVQTFNGKVHRFAFPRELSESLSEFSRKQNVTLFMTLLAGFQALLSRYSGQEDIVVGSPIANRNRAEIEELIGFFANTLVLRASLADDPTFEAVLSQAKETALGAFAHQDMPFERLVEELKPERSLSHNPLFQVVFSLQNVSKPDFELPGLQLKFIDRAQTSAKFDLSLFLTEGPEGIGGRVEYNTDLFNASTIERLMGHYRTLLQAAVASPQAKLSELPLLTPEERQQILVDWTATEADIPQQPVHELFAAQARNTPNAVAIMHGAQELTYRDLNSQADRVALRLQAAGVHAGDRVAILLDRSVDLVVAEIAVLKCGAAYVPIDPAFPVERKAFMITDCGAKVVLSGRGMESPHSPAIARINVEDVSPKAEPTDSVNIAVRPEAIAYVMYTSGSTGQPKGVLVPHRAINRLVLNNGYAKFEPTDRVAFASNPAFDATTLEVWAPLVNGGRIVVLDQAEVLDPAAFARVLTRYGVTVLWLTVGLFNEYAEALSEQFRKLRYLMTGGDALDPKTIARVLRCGPPQHLLNGYGPTETTTFATTHEIREVPEGTRSIPIGRPIANTRLYILDGNRQPVPIGVTGELYIGGAGVAQGYLNRPELTAERFVEDPFANEPSARMYKTGDLGKWLEDGTIEFQGRNDFQVKLRGFRIELGEIETVIRKHASVQDCVVIVRQDTPGDKRLTAYIIRKPNRAFEPSDLRNWILASLPDYMVPTAFVELERFPLSSNGKIDRRALPKPEASTATPKTVVPPRDELEAKLLTIWRQILNVERISITDNFFDLGGHSLTAVRLMSEIKNQTGKEIPLAALFQGATIEYLARIVRNDESVQETLIHKIQTGGSHPPLFAAVVAGVNALGYIPLAKHLGPDQPFYALQRPGPGPLAYRRPYTRKEYEEVAAEYIRAMQTIQPEGPYHLSGICEGAHIAFEMAYQLEAMGQKVNLLALFDTWVLENTQKPGLWSLYYYATRLRQLKGRSLRSVAGKLTGAARNRLHSMAETKPTSAKSDWEEAYWPSAGFVPHRVQCPITIFKLPKQPFYYISDPLMGWASRTNSGVQVKMIRHGRHKLFLREPYVRELAAALAASLESTRNGGPVTGNVTDKKMESSEAIPLLR